MIPSVYLAGASKELERCQRWIQALRQEGIPITYDWTIPVTSFGSSGPALKDYEKRAFARADFRGVQEADVLWLLVPAAPSTGAWVELGYALRGAGDFPDLRPGRKKIVVSPPCSDRCIFALLPAVVEYASDEEAFAAILSA